MENCSNNQNPNIKIYVVCHKESYVPENPYLFPVQVGTALASKRLDGMLHDDDGENISDKNKTYCELTAQYWAWKNEEADYYGFFHYRRYFAFEPQLNKDDGWGNIAYEQITDEVINEIKLDPDVMRELIIKYDVISVQGRKYPRVLEGGKILDVYHEYGQAAFQHREDLDITLRILEEKYPEFKEAEKQYMNSSIAHECNMFIMRKEIYHQYCEWLFDILFEAEKQIDMTWYSVEEYRVMGYLAERLCGIYYTYLKQQQDVKTFELPKTLFKDTTPRTVLEPAFTNEVPIVLSANNKFAPYLDIMIRSIVENASERRNYDIIVLCNDITEKNQSWIRTAAAGKENIRIRFIRVNQYFDAKKLFVDQHLSVETYYRLIIPEIMPDYHKILYLDCDMVADRDVAELYDMELDGCILGAVKDIDVAGQVNLKNGWEKYAVKELKLDKPYDYFQAGTLVMDLDELRMTASSQEIIKLALSRSWRCHDQDVLNVVCKNRVKYLPQQWNTMMSWEKGTRSRMQILRMAPRDLYEEYMAARKNPYMIHFAGYQKPWDVVDCDLAEYFWKYARLSPFYPQILENVLSNTERAIANYKIGENASVRKIVNKLLPYGSRRREGVKRIYRIILKG